MSADNRCDKGAGLNTLLNTKNKRVEQNRRQKRKEQKKKQTTTTNDNAI